MHVFAWWVCNPAHFTHAEIEAFNGADHHIRKVLAKILLTEPFNGNDVILRHAEFMKLHTGSLSGVPLILRIEIVGDFFRTDLEALSKKIGTELEPHMPPNQDFHIALVVYPSATSSHAGTKSEA